MDLLKDLKMSLLSVNFSMIYIIHKMFPLLKHHLNYLQDSIFECFLRSTKINTIFFNNFFTTYHDGKSWRRNIIKDLKSYFTVKKKLNQLKKEYLEILRIFLNIQKVITYDADEVMKEPFDSIRNRYQNIWESMKGSEFLFHYVYLLYYKYHKLNPNHGGSYLDSPDWIKNKVATINPINKKDNKQFQYPVTVVLNHEEIKKSAKNNKN